MVNSVGNLGGFAGPYVMGWLKESTHSFAAGLCVLAAGLATALAMTKAGLAVTVHERSEQLVDQGAGITLGPNATRVLYHLDIGPALEATSVVPPKMEYRHYSTGAVIKRVITGDFRAVYGSPYMRLHRWDLQHAMMMRLAEVAPGALRLGSGVDWLEHGGAGVTLRFTDGHTETADIVVAADGIRSAVREALFNPAPPVFAGFVAWRGLVPTALLPKHLHESAVAFGQGHHFNRYLVRRGELLNFVAVARRVQWEAEGWTIPAPIDEFQQRHVGAAAARVAHVQLNLFDRRYGPRNRVVRLLHLGEIGREQASCLDIAKDELAL